MVKYILLDGMNTNKCIHRTIQYVTKCIGDAMFSTGIFFLKNRSDAVAALDTESTYTQRRQLLQFAYCIAI